MATIMATLCIFFRSLTSTNGTGVDTRGRWVATFVTQGTSKTCSS
jgi:hypothetical protein